MADLFNYDGSPHIKNTAWRVPYRSLLRIIDSFENEDSWDHGIINVLNNDFKRLLEIEEIRKALRYMSEYKISVHDEYIKSKDKIILNLDDVKKYREANEEFEVLRMLHDIPMCYQEFDLDDPRNEIYDFIRQEFINL